MRKIKKLKPCKDNAEKVFAGFWISQRNMNRLKRVCLKEARERDVTPIFSRFIVETLLAALPRTRRKQ